MRHWYILTKPENYIPGMQWIHDDLLLIQQMNRHQNTLIVWSYVPSYGELKKIYTIILVILTFGGYLYIGYLNRVKDTKGFYVAGQGVPAIFNGAATGADWNVCSATARAQSPSSSLIALRIWKSLGPSSSLTLS